ncbi:single-stranded DNA-binding protein [bacterium]|nr:single-stranded DNA-binding protein [bacterium]
MAGKGSVNKVILMGHLGDNPELRYTPAGDAVVSFRIATNRVWKDKEGKQQTKTEWHRIIAWRKLAEICSEYLKKGSHIYVEGRMETRSWEDGSGNKKYTTEVVIATMQMLDGAPGLSTTGDKVQSSNNISGKVEEEIPF